MKISKSKQELARIISENGGWRDGAEWSAQDKRDTGGNLNKIWFYSGGARPIKWSHAEWWESRETIDEIESVQSHYLIKNWHQTILSREEYFHLYPAPDDKVNITVENNASLNVTVSDKPNIEQLAADYRNRKDCADRKQEEADAAKADADEALRKLELAGEAIWLIVTPVAAKRETDLAITDWRDLKVGDIIEYVDGDIKNKIGMTGQVVEFAPNDNDGLYVRMKCDNGKNKGRLGWPRKWRFIRRT